VTPRPPVTPGRLPERERRRPEGVLLAEYEFASNNRYLLGTRPTVAFDACFVVPMETSASSGRTKRLFHRNSIATIDAIELVFNLVNSYLARKYANASQYT
jgi:hypothetical protein